MNEYRVVRLSPSPFTLSMQSSQRKFYRFFRAVAKNFIFAAILILLFSEAMSNLLSHLLSHSLRNNEIIANELHPNPNEPKNIKIKNLWKQKRE